MKVIKKKGIGKNGFERNKCELKIVLNKVQVDFSLKREFYLFIY